jgi:hypothetical protein
MLTTIIRFFPGSVAALAGFVVLKMLTWLPVVLQLLMFLLAYLFVAVMLDKALKQYGRGKG